MPAFPFPVGYPMAAQTQTKNKGVDGSIACSCGCLNTWLAILVASHCFSCRRHALSRFLSGLSRSLGASFYQQHSTFGTVGHIDIDRTWSWKIWENIDLSWTFLNISMNFQSASVFWRFGGTPWSATSLRSAKRNLDWDLHLQITKHFMACSWLNMVHEDIWRRSFQINFQKNCQSASNSINQQSFLSCGLVPKTIWTCMEMCCQVKRHLSLAALCSEHWNTPLDTPHYSVVKLLVNSSLRSNQRLTRLTSSLETQSLIPPKLNSKARGSNTRTQHS